MKRGSKLTLAMLSVLLFSSLLISSFTVTPCKAVDYTKVGVKVGDWAYYSATTNASGSPPNFNANFTITNIDRSNLSATLTLYSGGTPFSSADLWGNISSGENGPTGAPPLLWFVTVPGLTKDDPIFLGAPYTINDTGTVVAGGLARAYAHINVTSILQEFYIDQATGIIFRTKVVVPTDGQHAFYEWGLNSTSLWSPPSYKVGVKVGDKAHYSFYSNATEMAEFTNANFTITNIDRGNVTADFAIYNSSTSVTFTTWENFTSGQFSISGFQMPWLLIAANLTTNDPLWLNGFAWITDTGTMLAAGKARVCNHANATIGSYSFDIRWDKKTGLGTGFNVLSGSLHMTWTLISTTLWSSPDYTKLGLKVGDWAYYSVRQDSGGVDAGLRNSNLTVTSIDRGNVTFAAKALYANGTIITTMMSGNVSSGTGTFGSFFVFYLTAANLGKNYQVTPTLPVWINDTVSVTIFGESRVCTYFTSGNIYLSWDQATGITTKANLADFGGPGNSLRWNMTSTSLWSPAPTIDIPTDLTYTFGTTGHSIIWHPLSNVPFNYTITRNGTVVSSESWNGQAITCSVDGLDAGTYVFNCTVFDTIGRHASSIVTVRVSAAQQPFPVELLIAGIAGIAVVVVVAAVVVLRKRGR